MIYNNNNRICLSIRIFRVNRYNYIMILHYNW